MPADQATYDAIKKELDARNVTLVAVSKTKPVEDILALYELGHRDFGENYVQELVTKQEALPKDIRWHFIGHLQTNKVKYIAPFVHLIHGVESRRLLQEIARQGSRFQRTISLLLQVHIAMEETKFGLNEEELRQMVASLADDPLSHISIKGMMGMASFTGNQEKIRSEFRGLKKLYDQFASLQTSTIRFDTLSMGMSADYQVAVEEGSNMVRIGSLLFGSRT